MGTCLCCPVSVPSHPFDSSSLLECVLPHLCTALFHWLLVYVGICLFSPICILPCPIGSSSCWNMSASLYCPIPSVPHLLKHVCVALYCSKQSPNNIELGQERVGAKNNIELGHEGPGAKKKEEPKQCTARAEKAAET